MLHVWANLVEKCKSMFLIFKVQESVDCLTPQFCYRLAILSMCNDKDIAYAVDIGIARNDVNCK